MRSYFPAFFILVMISLYTPHAYAATGIHGTVTAKRVDSVQVTFEPHETAGPAVGDAVSFSKEIPGTGGIKAKAGEGTVIEVDGTTVWVKTTDNRPNLKMDAVIMATGKKLEQPTQNKSSKRASIGISILSPTKDMRQTLDLPEDVEGALIVEVESGSAGEKAGLKVGDFILEFNGQQITSADDLPPLVKALNPGKKVLMLVRRDGRINYSLVVLDESE